MPFGSDRFALDFVHTGLDASTIGSHGIQAKMAVITK